MDLVRIVSHTKLNISQHVNTVSTLNKPLVFFHETLPFLTT